MRSLCNVVLTIGLLLTFNVAATDVGVINQLAGPLVDGGDGYRYGITTAGGVGDCGVIFRIDGEDKSTILYSLQHDRDGCNARSGLIVGQDSHLYGTTSAGGPIEPGSLPASANGTVFRISRNGSFAVLHAFSINRPQQGWQPAAALAIGPDGHFYGTTEFGGDACVECGVVFRITADGSYTRLHAFSGADGANPVRALVKGVDGRLYGMTEGESTGVATLFSISAAGEFAQLHSLSAESDLVTAQSLAVSMLVSVQTFDSTRLVAPLLDNFNRDNASSLGDNWVPMRSGFSDPRIGIRDNRAMANGDGPRSDYWIEPFAPDQEAYVYYPNNLGYDDMGIAVRYDPATDNGYAILPNANGVHTLSLARIQNGDFDEPYLDTVDGVINDGGWVGIRAVGNQITGWYSTDGENWQQVLSATDASFPDGGHVAIWLNNVQTLDDFHAGSLDVPPPTPPPTDNGNGDDGNGNDDGDNGGGDDDTGNQPGNGDTIEPIVTPITGSPGGGRRGGIGIGSMGLEFLVALALVYGYRRFGTPSRRLFS